MRIVNLRPQKKDLVFHSDRGSQYTSQYFMKLHNRHIRTSMADVGSGYKNTVVERFLVA